MIKIGSILRVVDNSGAKLGKCIQVRQKGKYPTGSVGDILLVTLKNFSNRKKVVKRMIYMGVIVGITQWIHRLDGSFVKFFTNRLLVFNKQTKFLGSRIYGVILKETKVTGLHEKKNQKYFHKVFSYSSGTI